ncbi:MAG TPA: glycoside hydrolase family 130 protein [Candidatus Acidoferrum sp.]|nr:glycoside hydrolase family 130 protein [Candidatus Acidoferrum sp.]
MSNVPLFVIRTAKTLALSSLIFVAFVVAAAIPFVPPFGVWTRLSADPIITPMGDKFESAGTFNPSVVKKDGKFVMLYRAQDRKGTSSLGYAASDDGIHFTRRPEPVLVSEAPYEKGGGVEDPRLQKVGDTYYLTYTGYNNVDAQSVDKGDAQLCLATSTDLIHWQRQGVIIPSYKGKWNVKWTKSGAIVPEEINGKYWMYYLGDAKGKDQQMGVAYSNDLLHWTEALDHPVMASRPGFFDSQVVEPGPPPIITPQGIFLVYNGADDKLIYSTGWVLFDKKDPTRILARSEKPVFAPDKDWEKVGQVPNVVFVEGMVRDGKRWLFYYGGADKTVGVATAPVL